MRTALLLPLVLLACAGPAEPPETDAIFGTSVDAWLEGANQDELRVQVSAPADATWTLDGPRAEGLALQPAGDERVERVGDRAVTTRRFTLGGPPGSYVIEAICATVAGSSDPPPCAPPIYVDVGVKPDRSELVDIVEPARPFPAIPWGPIAAGAVALAGVAAGAVALWRRRPEPVAAPVAPEPPDVVALRRWEAVRADPSLSDEEKAFALSEIFRAYLEDVLRFPARSWTTTETLAHLERLDALPKVNVPRAKRLLRATDRVKYAEVPPGESLFDELEGDLHGFVDQTRPRAWLEDAT